MVLRGAVRSALAFLGLTLAVLCAAPSPSWAQGEAPDLAERRAEAGKLADEGFELLEKGLHEQAVEKFRKADETLHSPMFVLFMSRAERARGRLVEARALLKGIVDEPLAEYAPDSFWKAKKDAQRELAALDAEIPRWSLRIAGASLSDVTLRLDGQPLGASEVSSEMLINPGDHLVAAESSDGRKGSSHFSAQKGQSIEVGVDVGPALPDDTPFVPTPGGEEGTSRWVPIGLAYGIGGASLLVAIITGAMFMEQAGELEDRCTDNQCPTDAEEDGDTVSLLGNVSTATWVIGGVGVVAGTVLLLVLDDDDEPPSSGDTEIGLQVGPTGFVVHGTF